MLMFLFVWTMIFAQQNLNAEWVSADGLCARAALNRFSSSNWFSVRLWSHIKTMMLILREIFGENLQKPNSSRENWISYNVSLGYYLYFHFTFNRSIEIESSLRCASAFISMNELQSMIRHQLNIRRFLFIRISIIWLQTKDSAWACLKIHYYFLHFPMLIYEARVLLIIAKTTIAFAQYQKCIRCCQCQTRQK